MKTSLSRISKTTKIVVVIFLLCTVALAWWYNKYNASPLTSLTTIITERIEDGVSPTEEDVFEVLYTSEGFSPKQIEVSVGTKIAFKNTSGMPMWVASDPHPIHSDYSAFDAQREYGADEIYYYTFDKTGTFGYHNHSHAHDRGFVTVVDSDHPLPVINKTLPGQEAIRDKLLTMLKPGDPDSIFSIIDTIQADPALSLNCHDVAHDIGHKAYELYGFSEAMTFNNPNHVKHPLVQYICAGGYMHGILEQLSLNKPEFLQTPDVICALLPEADMASCYHGVGHVFMLANTRNADESIEDCRLVEDSMNMYRCFEGVRMEQFWGNTEHVATSSLGWDKDKPLDTCLTAQEDEKPTCFLYSTFGYLRFHPKNYYGAVALCTESNLVETDAKFCLKGLGITMMSKFKGQNLEGSEVYVAGLSDGLRYAFYQGVLGYAHLSGVSKEKLGSTCLLFKTDSVMCLTVLQEIY
jgi:plastocyanin